MSTRVLVVPGIGDIHWVALKLRSFAERHGLGRPEIWIWNFDGRPRSLGFVERLPMCDAGGYWDHGITVDLKKRFNDCYMHGQQEAIANFAGFDWFLCVNGSLRVGRNLTTQILPKDAMEWDYLLKQTDAEIAYGRGVREVGPYVLLYFSHLMMFQRWLAHWPPSAIAEFVRHVADLLPKHRLIVTGSSWDKGPAEKHLDASICDRVTNMVGETTLDQLLGLIRNADGFAGWCGGNTIVSTHLGTPTYVLWSDYFIPAMRTNWADPKKVGTVYVPTSVMQTTPIDAARRFARMVMERR